MCWKRNKFRGHELPNQLFGFVGYHKKTITKSIIICPPNPNLSKINYCVKTPLYCKPRFVLDKTEDVCSSKPKLSHYCVFLWGKQSWTQLRVRTALLFQSISQQFCATGPWFSLLGSGVSLGKEEGERKKNSCHLFFSSQILLPLSLQNKTKISNKCSRRLCPKASLVPGSFVFAGWVLHCHQNGVPSKEGHTAHVCAPTATPSWDWGWAHREPELMLLRDFCLGAISHPWWQPHQHIDSERLWCFWFPHLSCSLPHPAELRNPCRRGYLTWVWYSCFW